MAVVLMLLAVPLIEIALFILVGGWIGLWATIALVVAMAVLGIVVMRLIGIGALGQVRSRLQSGQDPGPALANGALLLVAGVLLILPGFLTDVLGLLLLLPPVRAAVMARASGRLAGAILWQAAGARNPGPGGQIVDGVWHETPPANPSPGPRPSGWVRDPAD